VTKWTLRIGGPNTNLYCYRHGRLSSNAHASMARVSTAHGCEHLMSNMYRAERSDGDLQFSCTIFLASFCAQKVRSLQIMYDPERSGQIQQPSATSGNEGGLSWNKADTRPARCAETVSCACEPRILCIPGLLSYLAYWT
jgi:hypothetical protein